MLRGMFKKQFVNGHTTHVPYVRVGMFANDRVSPEVEGVIDTGASINLIAMTAGRTMLGKSREEIRNGKPLKIDGVGAASLAFGWKVDLRLRATAAADKYMLLKDVWVYFVETRLPHGDVLVGQFTGLEERVLVHKNCESERFWMLQDSKA